jgi:hypothetical protein
LLSAHVGKTGWRRRLVHVRPHEGFGPLEAIQPVLAAGGWQSTTACVERLTLTIRPHGAAGGRRGNPLCKGEAGRRPQVALSHIYDHVCWPHARLRGPWPQPLPTHGTGSAPQGRPWTPAMAAGRTERGWTWREVVR